MSFAQYGNPAPLQHPCAITSTFDSMLWTNYFENTLGFDFVSQNVPGSMAAVPIAAPTTTEDEV